jgi:hypothetical protein
VKTACYFEIDGKKIVSLIKEGAVDPEATKKAIAEKYGISIEKVIFLEDFPTVYEDNRVFFAPGSNEKILTDAEAMEFEQLFASLGEHEKLMLDKEIIPDYRGIEYWAQEENKWVKRKIEMLGVALAGTLDKDLTTEQRAGIAAQQETDRISELSVEDKIKERDNHIASLKREAVLKSQEAEIAEEEFDAKAWFRSKRAEIEAKYA